MELDKRIAFFTTLLLVGFAVCACINVGHLIMVSEEARVTRELRAAQTLFTQLGNERFQTLEAVGRVIVANHKPEDSIAEVRVQAHVDYVLVFDEEAKLIASGTETSVKAQGLQGLVKAAQETNRPVRGFSVEDGALRQMLALPMSISEKVSQVLVLGYKTTDDFFLKFQNMTQSELTVVGADEKVGYATLNTADFWGAGEEQSVALKSLEQVGTEPVVRGKFVTSVLSLSPGTSDKPVRLVLLRRASESLDLQMRARLRILWVALGLCTVGVFLSMLFGRSVTRPLSNLALKLRGADPIDLESLRRIAETSEAAGADRDVHNVLASFSQLAKSLYLERQQFDASVAKRVQELDKQMDGLRSHNSRLSAANHRLLTLLEKDKGKKAA